MTFIASLKVNKGIVQVSDSLELQTGAISRYDDFKKLLDTKGINEESEEIKLNAKEIWETFKPERIKNIDGAKKTFQLFQFGCLQVAGSVDINGREVKDIVQQLIDKITPKLPLSHQEIVDELLNLIRSDFPDREKEEFDNPDKRDLFPSTDFIYSHYEPKANERFIHKICYSMNGLKKKYVYSDRYIGIEDYLYFSSGMVGLANNFSSLNIKGTIFNDIDFKQGFQILKHAIELAILTEKINYDVPGVGGTINYSIIDNSGFRFIKNIYDLPE